MFRWIVHTQNFIISKILRGYSRQLPVDSFFKLYTQMSFGHLPHSDICQVLFCVFMDRDEVEVHKLAKKRTRPISSHLDRTNLVNKGFIIWLSGKFFMRDTAGSPERARWLHLACSGSQSHRTIWFILPARGASHIIIQLPTFSFLLLDCHLIQYHP